MHSEYIEQRLGGYYVAGTRISLDSVVYSFNGAIAFYVDHQAEVAQGERRS